MTLEHANLTGSGLAMLALGVFVLAYGFVIAEEFTQLRKSKPVIVAAGVIWVLVAHCRARCMAASMSGALLEHNLLEYAELLLFLLSAMTYVNTLRRAQCVRGAALLDGGAAASRCAAIFWLTGLLAFFLSPVLDNLTTALVMGAVVLSVGRGNPRFLVPACINIVVAANAGGAFSPFGDITTLMVWQKGVVNFTEFFALFLPSLVNWLVPALCMHFAVPRGQPAAGSQHARQ